MTIKEFVNRYKIATTERKEDLVKSVIARHYVPLMEKKTISELMIDKSHGIKNGVDVLDSTLLYLNYVMAIIISYTNFDMNKEEATGYENYDTLAEYELVEVIMNAIGKDVLEYKTIYQKLADDWAYANTTTEALINKYVDKFGTIIGTFAGSGLDNLLKYLETADPEDVKKKLDVVTKVVDFGSKLKK